MNIFRVGLKNWLGILGTPIIVPYTAYGDRNKILITGAVIEDKGLAKPEPDQSLWKNFLTMAKRYAGDELSGIRVQITYGDMTETVRTNERGLFHTVIPNSGAKSEDGSWHPVRFTLLDEVTDRRGRVKAESEIHIVHPDADFLVVSDIDDTVMVSHATKRLKKLHLMLSRNAHTRSPFKGVAAFYRALQHKDKDIPRSIFYVSASEWNLFDLVSDFLNLKGIPRGTLLLSDRRLRLFRFFSRGRKKQEKLNRIMALFELYHDHHFILIGDSAQNDPEIYLQIGEMYPSRVKAIYIRYVGRKRRNRRLESLVGQAGELGIEMIPVHTTSEAARHSLKKGYISEQYLQDVRSEELKDTMKPPW